MLSISMEELLLEFGDGGGHTSYMEIPSSLHRTFCLVLGILGAVMFSQEGGGGRGAGGRVNSRDDYVVSLRHLECYCTIQHQGLSQKDRFQQNDDKWDVKYEDDAGYV